MGIAASGGYTEVSFTVESAGAGDAGKGIGLGSDGKIHTSVLPSGVGAELQQVTWAENVSLGEQINVYDDSGTLKGRKADGGTNKYESHGFAYANGTQAATGYVQAAGLVTTTGLTPGGRVYLSGTTAGAITQTVVTGSGKLYQVVGKALSTTVYYCNPEEPVVRA